MKVAAFVRGLSSADLPAAVVSQAQRCLLDLAGVAVAGSRSPAAAIMNAFVISEGHSSEGARLLLHGGRAGRAGAALAGATTIDAFDAHDGHVLTKGHAGAALLPAALAFVDGGAPCDGAGFLTAIVIGYEIATRAGIALHASVPDYHCSGAWNALGCAAVGARLLDLDEAQLAHALGIAEYFGPRGQILRVCASPSMLKDGSGWGAHAGVSAALLAQAGFTGAPAMSAEGAVWNDLGSRWRILEQYFKPHPVCRWAQPAIEAVLSLKTEHDAVAAIQIESFKEAVDLGSNCPAPRTSDEAQYSIAYPVAAALVFGQFGAGQLESDALTDARVARLMKVTRLEEKQEFSSKFPAERWARVRLELRNGRKLVSEPARARGNPENPLSDAEMRAKYRSLAEPALGPKRAARIEALVDALASERSALPAFLDELLLASRSNQQVSLS
jgi:2-methylcitrate dehydratase PrpD